MVGGSALLFATLNSFVFFTFKEYVEVYRVWLNLCQLDKNPLRRTPVSSMPFNIVVVFIYLLAAKTVFLRINQKVK